jgi:hypothetical protein
VKRRRGRPPRDYSDDLRVAEFAIALQAAWGLSERMAIDLGLAVLQGEPGDASKMPRSGAGKPGTLIGYRLPMLRSFSSRNADIRRKLKMGKLRPRAAEVLRIARLLHLIHRV